MLYCKLQKLSLFIICYACIFQMFGQSKYDQEIDANWFQLDLINDSIPGISLIKAYDEILKEEIKESIVVAVIDMSTDINHEDLKDQIWTNIDEIPDNNIDDDKNGYIDDIHGWNFLGNAKGENVLFANYEYTRIIRKYDSVFKDKGINDISNDVKDDFLLYRRAKKKYEERLTYAKNDKAYIDYYDTGYIAASKALKNYFPKKKYTKKKLDSLKNRYKDDKFLNVHLDYMLVYVQYKLTPKWIQDYKQKAYERLGKLLNLDYDERLTVIGDNPQDITNIGYGNNQVDNNLKLSMHGTKMAGVIAATRDNGKGIDGILNNVEIIPLLISPFGNEHDKDMALAIRYAVDNGAKVINISSSKEFSLYRKWVSDAIKYAEKKDVLIVTSAGNNGYDLEDPSLFNYPEDSDNGNNEIVSNFIKVGASSYHLNKGILNSVSNYGKTQVDLFAPSEKTLTLVPYDGYEREGGTSISCAIVSGVAALIRSHYPGLSASQVKEILMKSGTSYDIEVEVEQGDKTKKMIPFSELSKSGKIVNAYNALQMAKQFSLE